MATENMTKEQREKYWQMVIDDFKEADVTKAEYCRKNEIAVSTFNYWESRLKEGSEEMHGSRFVELAVPSGEPKTIRYSSSLVPPSGDAFAPQAVIAIDKIRILVKNTETPRSLITTVLEAVSGLLRERSLLVTFFPTQLLK